MENQKKYTEEILFNNYMISANGEECVHCQIPFYFKKDTYDQIVEYSEEINSIALRILKSINGQHKRLLNYFEDFKFKEDIFNLTCDLSEMFWTRYDTFIDEENSIYFSEFNYDKPCGQKEMALAGKSIFKNNINKNFIEHFKSEFINICKDYTHKEEVNVAFLIDPCHYEELHHSYYFKYIFEGTGINIISAGPENLVVKDGFVYVFGEIKADVILRLFPTEFSFEIPEIKGILQAFDNGNVLILNDPRIIAIQAKGFFAYLWDLIEENSGLLSGDEKELIKECIPYTKVIDLKCEKSNKELIRNKDLYVIKSSLGRYSEEVYIGKMYDKKEWKKQIELLKKRDKIYIRQDFIKIRQEFTYASDGNNSNIPLYAYGNFGTYIMKEKVEGMLVRWSSSFITDDNYTWMCPLGYDESPVRIENCIIRNKEEMFEDIYEDAAFNYNFTGAYTKTDQYISLNPFIIKSGLYDEIMDVGKKFMGILNKTYPTVKNNMHLFGKILGIPEDLDNLIKNSSIDVLCALGRIDLVLDNENNLKILEFNSETPAGIDESMNINGIIKKKMNIKYMDPNEGLKYYLKDNIRKILGEIEKKRNVENIAVVTTWYYEDIYTAQSIGEVIKSINDDYNVIFGNIYDLEIREGKIFLYGKEVHAIYRHYPLDWFSYEEEMNPFIKVLENDEYLINPAHTLIVQSKAFFAVIYELMGKGFFTEEEEGFINKYIPYTCLERNKNLSCDHIIKPCLSREGMGVRLSCEENGNVEDDVVFQDRINIKAMETVIYSSVKNRKEYVFPIIGVYICDKDPCGLYVRGGRFITDKNSVYLPSFVE